MKKSNKKLAFLCLGAAASVAMVWGIDVIALHVMRLKGISEDRLVLWQPKVLFASFIITLLALCILLQFLVPKKNKTK